MREKIKEKLQRKRQLILYLLFGTFTSICSLVACYVTLKLGTMLWQDEQGDPTAFVDVLGSTVQWVVGVLIAFLTNKKWVFIEAEHGGRATMKQLSVFAGSRVVTYFLEVFINLGVIALLEGLRYRAPEFSVLGANIELSARVWAKVVSSVIVVISNYYISKMLVFRQKGKKKDEES